MKVAFRTTLDSELLMGLKQAALRKGKHVNEILDDLIYSYLNYRVSQDEMEEINKLREKIRAVPDNRKLKIMQEHISDAISKACWETGYTLSRKYFNVFENLGEIAAEIQMLCGEEIPLPDEKK